jgi:hypothetical protein
MRLVPRFPSSTSRASALLRALLLLRLLVLGLLLVIRKLHFIGGNLLVV